MFLHIGNNETVKQRDVIGIFDLDTASVSPVTRDFLARAQEGGHIRYDDTDLPRSFLVLSEEKKTDVRLSRISTAGLKTRLDTPFDGTEE